MKNEEEAVFQLILHAGNGRSSALEALAAVKEKDFELAKVKLKESSAELAKAHHIQTSLIQQEINGKKVELSLLMIHAQDHLMNAITVRELVSEIVAIHEKLNHSVY